MARKRNKENAGLPKRWAYKNGAYYYLVPPLVRHQWDNKAWFRLGATLPEAYKIYGERAGAPQRIAKIGELLDRYELQVVPTKAPKTQTENHRALIRLRKVFGEMAIDDLEPQHIYQYVDHRVDVKTGHGLTAAHREIEVLSHAFTKAVEWGQLKAHPFREEVRLDRGYALKPRTRYIEDWEILEALALPSVRQRGSVGAIQAYIRLKLLTGLRRGDLLRLRVQALSDTGIEVRTSKTGKSVVFEWTPERRAAVASAMSARPVDISPWVFCNNKGECYLDETTGEARGWSSMWQRFMSRVLKETAVKERFTEHDIRAKVGSDAESLERARQLLTHADSKITQRVYRRKPEVIK